MTKKDYYQSTTYRRIASSRRDGEKTKTSEESHTKGMAAATSAVIFASSMFASSSSNILAYADEVAVDAAPTSVEAQYEAAQQVGGGEKAPELKGESSSAVAEPSSVPAVDAPTPASEAAPVEKKPTEADLEKQRKKEEQAQRRAPSKRRNRSVSERKSGKRSRRARREEEARGERSHCCAKRTGVPRATIESVADSEK